MTKKTIQVVLNKDVYKLGKSGEIKTVSLGYARNYLLPTQTVSLATKKILQSIERQLLIKKQHEQELINRLEILKQSIQKIGQITINKKVSNTDTIFGSVTDREIAEILAKNLGEDIDRKSIVLPEIKEIGNYEIIINLGYKINAKVNLQVIPQ
jgi:large subunit ribosomal protein L9